MPTTGHVRVLLAHEEEAVRSQLHAWLAGWGYDVVPAADGADAWEVLRHEDAPRLVILGTGLTGMRATDVCRAARARPMEPYAYVALIAPPGAGCDLEACLAAQA